MGPDSQNNSGKHVRIVHLAGRTFFVCVRLKNAKISHVSMQQAKNAPCLMQPPRLLEPLTFGLHHDKLREYSLWQSTYSKRERVQLTVKPGQAYPPRFHSWIYYSKVESVASCRFQIERSSRKIFTAHYACRNAASNLTPLTGTTNGFTFHNQFINRILGGTLDLLWL